MRYYMAIRKVGDINSAKNKLKWRRKRLNQHMTTNIKIQHKTWLDISKLDDFYYISKMQLHSNLALAKLLCSRAMSLVALSQCLMRNLRWGIEYMKSGTRRVSCSLLHLPVTVQVYIYILPAACVLLYISSSPSSIYQQQLIMQNTFQTYAHQIILSHRFFYHQITKEIKSSRL